MTDKPEMIWRAPANDPKENEGHNKNRKYDRLDGDHICKNKRIGLKHYSDEDIAYYVKKLGNDDWHHDAITDAAYERIMCLIREQQTVGPESGTADGEKYYVQDTRQIVGNDMMWWAIDGKGYTTDINKAHVFDKATAISTCTDDNGYRRHFTMWPKAYIDQKTRPAVDVQYVRYQDTGLEAFPKAPDDRSGYSPHNCDGCGRFLTDKQSYTGCDNCGSAP